MLNQRPLLVVAALAAILPLSLSGAAAETRPLPGQLAMMDMMPTQPGGNMGDDDRMRMPDGMQQAPGAGQAGGPAMPGGASGMQQRQPAQMQPAPGGMRMGDDDRMGMPGGMGSASGPQQQQAMMGGCQSMMQMMQGMMRMGGGAPATGSSAARLEGRIAFLRTELRITDAQASAWDAFAATLRSGREHLDAARAALQESGSAADPMARLASFESHLRERVEAIHKTRMAFDTLYGQLDDAQKRAATATMLPFIGAF